jgi:serine/threonine-protein kinase
VGATRADAEAKLAAVQLVASVEEQYSDTVPQGIVISSGIPAGTEVERDSPVPLVVSAGPPPIPVPNVLGQSGSSGAAALEAAGFVVAAIEGSPSGVILATDPPAGEPHLRGTPVRIFTRR